jgi:hypothetical protein
VLKLAVSAISAVPAPREAASGRTSAVAPAYHSSFSGFTYESGDMRSSWDTQAC